MKRRMLRMRSLMQLRISCMNSVGMGASLLTRKWAISVTLMHFKQVMDLYRLGWR